jgi:hypothetical protein
MWLSSSRAYSPQTPSLIATAVSSSEIDLFAFDADPIIINYTFQSAPTATGPWTTLATQTSPSYHNTGLAALTTYYYRVQATTPLGVSPFSVIQSATTPSSGGGPGVITDSGGGTVIDAPGGGTVTGSS